MFASFVTFEPGKWLTSFLAVYTIGSRFEQKSSLASIPGYCTVNTLIGASGAAQRSIVHPPFSGRWVSPCTAPARQRSLAHPLEPLSRPEEWTPWRRSCSAGFLFVRRRRRLSCVASSGGCLNAFSSHTSAGGWSSLPGFCQRAAGPNPGGSGRRHAAQHARLAYNQKNYPFAADRFREFLGKYGQHKEVLSARYGLALCLIEGPAKDYPAAIDQLQQVAANKEFADYPYALYYLALSQRVSASALRRQPRPNRMKRPSTRPKRNAVSRKRPSSSPPPRLPLPAVRKTCRPTWRKCQSRSSGRHGAL